MLGDVTRTGDGVDVGGGIMFMLVIGGPVGTFVGGGTDAATAGRGPAANPVTRPYMLVGGPTFVGGMPAGLNPW